MSSGLLLAFGFLNPVLLWGLGLAVPILIYLLSRRYVAASNGVRRVFC